ncbi:ash family protein [Serratia marcescens]|uniref:Ash family protein n=1 Tax=Serratia marcescens TaxID=615 RepID=A0A939NNS8_SERMA|nr:ash family protein [Serratia marcescens]
MFNYGDTTRASVFLCRSLSALIFARWMLCYRSSQSMVAQAGQPSGWPVYIVTGFSPRLGYHPCVRTSVVAVIS